MAAIEGIKVVLTLDDQISVAVKGVQNTLRNFVSEANRTANATEALQKNATSLKTRFRELVQVGGMLRFVMYDIRDVFNATFGAVIKSSAEIERMTVLMRGLSRATTDQAKAQEALASRNFVFNLSKKAPFEVGALSDAFVKFKTAGLDPTNGSLQALVDSVAKFGGSSEQLKRASVAIQQMSGKGVISMEELRQQLGEAVPSAMKLMAQGMGITMGALVNAVSKGTVQSKNALERMAYQMKITNSGAAEAMMQTWNGQFEKLKTNIKLFLNDVGNSSEKIKEVGGQNAIDNSFFGQMKDALKEINEYLESSDGKQLAADLAFGLANAAKNLIAMAKAVGSVATVIRQNWTEIKRVIEVVATLYVGSKIFNYFKLLAISIKSVNDKFKIYSAQRTAEALGEIQNQRKVALQNARASNSIIAQESALTRAKLTEITARRAAQEADYALQIAAQNKAQNALNNNRSVNGRKAALFRVQQARQQMSAINTTIDSLKAKENQLGATVVANGQRMSVVRRQAIADVNRLKGAIGGITGTLSKVANGLAFIAGPIATVSAVISLGVVAWQIWGKTAIQSLDSAIQKTREYASAKSLAELGTSQKQVRESLNQDEKDLSAIKNSPNSKDGFEAGKRQKLKLIREKNFIGGFAADEKAVLKALEGRIAKQKNMLEEGDAVSKTSTTILKARAISDFVAGHKELTDIKIKAIDEDYQRLQNTETTRLDELTANNQKSAAKNAKTFLEFQKREVTKSNNAKIAFLTKDVKLQQDIIDSGKYKNPESIAKLKAAKLSSENQIAALKKEQLEETNKIGTQVYMPKEPKTTEPKLSEGDKAQARLQSVVEGLKEFNAGMRAELEEGGSNIAKAKEMISNGDFDPKGKAKGERRYTQDDLLAESAIKDAQIKRKKDEEKLTSELESVKSKLIDSSNAVAEELDRANETFNNGGNAAESTRVLAIRKFSKNLLTELEALKLKLPENISEIEEAMSQVEKITQSDIAITNQIDLKNAVAPMAEQTKQLQNQLLEDTRASKKALFEEEQEFESKKFALKVKAVGEETELAKEGMRQFTALQKAQLDVFTKDNRTQLQKLAIDWQNTTEQLDSASVGWLNNATDALVEFTKTGKLNFRSLAQSIITDLIRIKIQQQLGAVITQVSGGGGAGGIGGFLEGLVGSAPLGGAGTGDSIMGFLSRLNPFADGGIMTALGSMNLKKYANGGIASTPQLALFGEGKMNEAYVPLPDGRSIPVTMKGGANGGGETNITIQINNDGAPNTTSTSDADNGTAMRQFGERIAGMIKQELIEQKRPGGLLAR